jgi:glutaredoxin
MSLTLYFAPGACSFVPHCLLEASGTAYEPTMVKLHKGEQYDEAYKAINPRSQVPVLVDEGQSVTQIVDGLFARLRHGAGQGPRSIRVDEQHRAPHVHPCVHAQQVQHVT